MPERESLSQDRNGQDPNGQQIEDRDSSNQTEIDSQSEIENLQIENGVGELSKFQQPNAPKIDYLTKTDITYSWRIFFSILVMGFGLISNQSWIGWIGIGLTITFALPAILPLLRTWLDELLPPRRLRISLGFVGFVLAIALILDYIGLYTTIYDWLTQFKYDEFGSWADWIGAFGQIAIAIVAVYIAWRQYVISKDLTIQQNRITQQQTIDNYFQGITELALNEEGLLEDWPQERAIAEGRTAAILSGVDASGKAKVLRFLSQSRLLTPLQRDRHLGRPILDGSGGYAEDRQYGVRVIDLGVMLAGTNLSYQDLRWTDLSEANMVRANLSNCDLVKANLSRTVLYEANLNSADLKSARLFYGSAETASPRSRIHLPDYETGAYTGAVVEKANFTRVQRLSEEQRCYLCAWGGKKVRATIPGGCEGIPDKLNQMRQEQEK